MQDEESNIKLKLNVDLNVRRKPMFQSLLAKIAELTNGVPENKKAPLAVESKSERKD